MMNDDGLHAAHAANYERESKQETMTVRQLMAALQELDDNGYGERPVFRMLTGTGDGLTHALAIVECFESQPYDGDVVWLIDNLQNSEAMEHAHIFKPAIVAGHGPA